MVTIKHPTHELQNVSKASVHSLVPLWYCCCVGLCHSLAICFPLCSQPTTRPAWSVSPVSSANNLPSCPQGAPNNLPASLACFFSTRLPPGNTPCDPPPPNPPRLPPEGGDGTAVAVPEDQLPLTLPETDQFKPSGSPESPLAAIDSWVNTTDPETGGA